MNKILAIVGMAGSGKSVVADELIKKGYKFLRFGQITMDIIKKKGYEVNEKNEKKIREGLRKKYGMGAYATLNIPKIDKFLKEGDVVVDGLYSWTEYKVLKEKYKENFFVIAVYSPPELRYERLEKRKTEVDDKDIRNRPIEKDQVKWRDYSEIQNIEKGGPIAMADYLIDNTKGLDYLKNQIEELLKKIHQKGTSSGRKDYISWDDYFMGVAVLSSMRSKDPSTQVGACIVDPDKKIVGTGYNGAPRGIEDDSFPWAREGDFLETKYAYVCHAELNAILNSTKENLKGCTLYVALFPCNECAKAIIQSGIKKVVYLSDKYKDTPAHIASKKMLTAAMVELVQLKPQTDYLKVNFDIE